MAAVISFINFCCNFNSDFFYLVGYVASSGFGSLVGILSKFFIRNKVFWKLLRTFSLALKIILSYLKKTFSNVFIPFSKLFNSVAKLLCLLLASSSNKCPSFVSVKKAIGKEYSLKL